jgi:hypothetical protein
LKDGVSQRRCQNTVETVPGKISKGIVNSSLIEARGRSEQKNWNNFNGGSHAPFAIEV